MNRRHFLHASGLASAGWLGSLVAPRQQALGAPKKDSWSFIHYTDVHVQPELRAEEGYRQAVKAMNAVRPKLAIAGGDLVFDACETGFDRADQLFKIYTRVTAGLDMPVHAAIGNHDVFGVSPKAGVPETHPEFGKKMFAERVGQGRTYRSFDFRDWHFILLDSIFVTPDRSYEGRIDDAQLAWLQQDLRSVGSKRPVVLVTHIPFCSIFPALQNGPTQAVSSSVVIANSKQVLDSCAGYNIKLLLQGHLHVVEDLRYRGSQYITSGAVCGNWWKGVRMGHPEGFAVYTIQRDQVAWSYRTYGWQAVPA
jgi:3',5'-cyclic AMP phosphodiesterase CpdA